MYITWQLTRTPFVNNSFVTASSTTLTDFRDPKIEVALGDTKNSFSFNVPNFNHHYDNYFNIGDKIELRRILNSDTTSTNDVILVGCINDLPSQIESNQNYIKVSGYDFSSTVLGGIVFADYTTSTLTIPQALSFALTTIKNYNPNFAVIWDSSNPSTKVDGTAFPSVSEKFYYKAFSTFIEKYSSSKYTTDAYSYFYYVNNQNNLIWRPRLNTPTGSFDSSIDNYKSLKYTKDIKDVKNFVVVQGGVDPNNRSLQTVVPDYISIAKNGMKFYVLVDENSLAKTLNANDITSLGGSASVGTLPSKVSGFTYPHTFTWNAGTASTSLSCTSDTDYVNKFRTFIIDYLKIYGKSYIDNLKNGKLKIDIEFSPGTKTWALGDVISCNIPMIASTSKNLRITEISYSSSSDTYSLEEDIGSL